MDESLYTNKFKLVIIGGGAAGFFCAANINHPNIQVTLLEKTSKLLSKVKVSGGGRCNVTNGRHESIQDFANDYPRGKNLLKKTLHRFSYSDTIDWFQSRGVALKEEADGRVFPVSNNSQCIIDCLMEACRINQVSIKTSTPVSEIKRVNGRFLLNTNVGEKEADFVCIATGGYPKREQYKWLQDLVLSIEPPVPSLFTFNLPGNDITSLMGVSVPNAVVKIQGSKLSSSGPLLITHWGLSGPCILRLSAWGARFLADCDWEFNISINWTGAENEEEFRREFLSLRTRQGDKILSHKNPFGLPSRLWEYLLVDSRIDPEIRWSELSSKNQNRLIHTLIQYECEVQGKTTFKEEFVTAGGVSLKDIQSQTMESRIVPNLFIIGEAMDVDGITGGFNFQNAWTSGYIAAKQIMARVDAKT